MTLTELALLKLIVQYSESGLGKDHLSTECLRILEREINLKTMDPRQPMCDVKGNQIEE